jgi:hypothetical protein
LSQWLRAEANIDHKNHPSLAEPAASCNPPPTISGNAREEGKEPDIQTVITLSSFECPGVNRIILSSLSLLLWTRRWRRGRIVLASVSSFISYLRTKVMSNI